MNEFFQNEMKELLKGEYSSFLATQNQPMYKGLRINPVKAKEEELVSEGFDLSRKADFCDNVYYLNDDVKPGNHPFHAVGLYYVQEPSACLPAEALGVQKNERILDMCASPGGKTTQILSKLDGTGLLWSNEINRARAMTLLGNLERWGSSHYLLTSCDSMRIASVAYGYFDRVLVDAPCSGAGMFKKYPETVNEYNLRSVLACQSRQLEILENAYKCVKDGGCLVYSTCTYNLYENELVVKEFLHRHPDCELVSTGLRGGRCGIETEGINWKLVTRMFPMDGGEGQFIAKMTVHNGLSSARISGLTPTRNNVVDSFMKENFIRQIPYYVKDNEVFLYHDEMLKTDCIRQSILLGEISKGRFEPHHHLAMYAGINELFRQFRELDEKQAYRYLSGEVIEKKGIRGYVILTYKNHPLGLGKGDGRVIKNRFPKGLRLLQKA